MRKKGEHAIGSPDPDKKRADESTQKLNQTNSLEIMTRKWKKKHNGTEIKKKKKKISRSGVNKTEDVNKEGTC